MADGTRRSLEFANSRNRQGAEEGRFMAIPGEAQAPWQDRTHTTTIRSLEVKGLSAGERP